jgi:hypothetical protein
MATTYSTTPERQSRLESIILAPVAALCWLMERTYPASERGGQR